MKSCLHCLGQHIAKTDQEIWLGILGNLPLPTLMRTSLWDTPSTTGGLLWEGLLERRFGNILFAKIKETYPKDCRETAWDNPPPTWYVISGETITHIARPKLRKKKA